MSPKLVHCTNLDSIRIETLGTPKALTIPAALPLAADAVMRDLGMDTNAMLSVYVDVCDDGPRQWHAWLHGRVGRGVTPWAAILDLAEKLS